MVTLRQGSASWNMTVGFFGVQKRVMELLAVIWEVKANGLDKVGGVDSNLDKNIEGLDCRLINGYCRRLSLLSKPNKNLGHTKTTVPIVYQHVASQRFRGVIIDATCTVRDIAHDHGKCISEP